MESFALSNIGKKRERNEDSFLRDEDRGLFIVCDGMGGHKGGDVASRLAVEVMATYFRQYALPEDDYRVPEMLLQAVRLANYRVWETAKADPELSDMGTTLTAALIRNGWMTAAHIGDSSLYLFRGREVTKLTRDHTLAEKMMADATRSAQDDDAEAYSAYRHVLMRALGTQPSLQADIIQESLTTGDILLLCSDGLTNLVADEAIKDLLIAAPTLPEAAEALIDGALEQGGLDNVTVLLVKI
jgi:protein phosphatase